MGVSVTVTGSENVTLTEITSPAAYVPSSVSLDTEVTVGTSVSFVTETAEPEKVANALPTASVYSFASTAEFV